MIVFCLIVLSCSMGILGDIFLKTATDPRSLKFGAGVLCYLLTAGPVWLALRMQTFASIAIAWQAISLSLALLVAVLFFKESLSSRQIAALAFTVAAIVLLQTEPAKPTVEQSIGDAKGDAR
jgi:multidrug transporter EmrE-like cation transporter